ncbi:MAG: hypothetical protein IKV31_05530 [Paludibacteraceae bacterium]|nr:hypothetical protein [Paludibacteraceae bacterium]
MDLLTIITWFQKGCKPTAKQFEAVFRSFFHKDDKIPQSSIDGLPAALAAKASASHTHTLSDITNLSDISKKQDKTDNSLLTTAKNIVDAINELWDKLNELWNKLADYLKGIQHVTHEQLVTLRNNAELKPGQCYRITDYLTTVANDPEARSAGHPFDLLVVATDVDTLSEEARVIKSLRKDMTPARFYSPSMGAWFVRDETNDGIYNGEQLYAWRSAGEYAFTKKLIPEDNADVFVAFDTDGNGWGTLYSIETLENFNEIGEDLGDVINSNEYFADANLNAWKVWYCLDNDDTRYKWADTENGKGVIWRMIDEWGNDCPYDFKNVQFKRYAILGITSSKLTEDAISYLQSALCYDQNGGRCFATKDVYGNWVPVDVDGTSYEIDETLFEWYYTFHSLSSHDGETIMDSYDMSTRPFKILDECIKYYKEDDCGMDSKDECHDNIIKPAYQEYDQDDEYFKGRLVLNNIVFLNGLSYCYYNDIDEYWEYCSGYCYGNVFGVECKNNTFGNSFRVNTFGNNCYYNTFGNNCWGNTFGSYFQTNTFGNGCGSNTFGNNVRYLTVHDGVQCVAVTGGSNNSYVQYAQILNGTRGQDSNNRLQISFQSNVNYCQFAGQNSSGILKIWVPADTA